MSNGKLCLRGNIFRILNNNVVRLVVLSEVINKTILKYITMCPRETSLSQLLVFLKSKEMLFPLFLLNGAFKHLSLCLFEHSLFYWNIYALMDLFKQLKSIASCLYGG